MLLNHTKKRARVRSVCNRHSKTQQNLFIACRKLTKVSVETIYEYLFCILMKSVDVNINTTGRLRGLKLRIVVKLRIFLVFDLQCIILCADAI